MAVLGALISKFRVKLEQRLLLQVLLDRLKSMGLFIMPYFLLLEECRPETIPAFPAEVRDAYQPCFLTAEDMTALHHVDGRTHSAEELIDRLKSGRLCLALKKDGQVAVFTWVNLRQCDAQPELFDLSPDDVYLCDTHTVKAFRGNNLAVLLRSFVYETADKMNRRYLYSISERFNRSSLRFKEKLDARIVRSCVYFELFETLRFRWVLRDYSRMAGGGKRISTSPKLSLRRVQQEQQLTHGLGAGSSPTSFQRLQQKIE